MSQAIARPAKFAPLPVESAPASERSLSPEARAMLQAGLKSALTEPLYDLGSFAQYADEDDEDDEPRRSERRPFTGGA
jgi:hypothetical protein